MKQSDSETELLKKVHASHSVTGIDNTDLMIKLLHIGTKEFEKKTVEGRLSSILIYQQILEACLINLLKMSNLIIQAEVFPNRIKFGKTDRMMFGQIVEAHKSTLDFVGKDEFLKLCSSFNHTRIQLVHKLFQVKKIEEIVSVAENIDNKFYKLIDLWSIAQQDLNLKIKAIKVRPIWAELAAEFNE